MNADLLASLDCLVELADREQALRPAVAFLEADPRVRRLRRDAAIRAIRARFFSRFSTRVAATEIARALDRRAERHRRLARANMPAPAGADPFDAALDQAIEASGCRLPGKDMIRRLLSEKLALATCF